MAVNGTTGNDFIHVSGDGQLTPPGYTDNPGATNGNDDINSGNGGSDIIYAGDGFDTINFASDLDATDQIAGGGGDDTLTIQGQTDIAFGASSLASIEKILLPFIVLPEGVAGSQSLTMNDANLAAGATMRIDAGDVGENTSLSFNANAETDGHYIVKGGTGGDSIICGGPQCFVDMALGGNDFVQTDAGGNDSITFGNAFTPDDRVLAGGGDTLGLSGTSYGVDFSFGPDALVSSGATLLLGTGNTYDLITDDANVVAGSSLHLQPNGPADNHPILFDGSAETDGSFGLSGGGGNDVFIGGRGHDSMFGNDGNDTINIARGGFDNAGGGAGSDRFAAGANFDALNHIDGGTEIDTLSLKGDYANLVFGFGMMVNVEKILLGTGHDYHLVMHDTAVAAGETLIVNGSKLGAADRLIFGGAAETDGKFNVTGGAGDDSLTGGDLLDRLTGGLGGDVLRGGLGSDHFIYLTAAESTGIHYDIAKQPDFAHDKWDLAANVLAIDPIIDEGRLGTTQFNAKIAAAADAGHLAAHHAVVFTPDQGSLAGTTWLIVDWNGVAGYQAGADQLVKLEHPQQIGQLDSTDFI